MGLITHPHTSHNQSNWSITITIPTKIKNKKHTHSHAATQKMKGEINAAMKEHGHGEIVRKLKFNNISNDIFIIYIIKVDHIIKIPYKENSSSYFDLDQRKSCNVNPPGISYTL